MAAIAQDAAFPINDRREADKHQVSKLTGRITVLKASRVAAVLQKSIAGHMARTTFRDYLEGLQRRELVTQRLQLQRKAETLPGETPNDTSMPLDSCDHTYALPLASGLCWGPRAVRA